MLNAQINFFYSTSPPFNALSLPPACVLLKQLHVSLSSSDGGCPASLMYVCAFVCNLFSQQVTEILQRADLFSLITSNGKSGLFEVQNFVVSSDSEIQFKKRKNHVTS